jgi:hypothetical protein
MSKWPYRYKVFFGDDNSTAIVGEPRLTRIAFHAPPSPDSMH